LDGVPEAVDREKMDRGGRRETAPRDEGGQKAPLRQGREMKGEGQGTPMKKREKDPKEERESHKYETHPPTRKRE